MSSTSPLSQEKSFFLHISKTIADLFSLELEKQSFYILLNVETFAIFLLEKKRFFSKIIQFFHRKIAKDSVAFDEAVILTMRIFRKSALDLIYSFEKTITFAKDHRKEREELERIFSLIEKEIHSLLMMLKSSFSKERELVIDYLKEAEDLIEKEKAKTLVPLSSYLLLMDEWYEKVEKGVQDIATKELEEKISFLNEGGVTLAKLIQKKKTSGKWSTFLDIEGKNALFQESAQKILQSMLKGRNNKKEIFALFRSYITLLQNPLESTHFLNSLREAFSTKYNEAILQKNPYLQRVHQDKVEMEKRVLLLKYEGAEKKDTLDAIRKKLQEERKEKEVIFPPLQGLEKGIELLPQDLSHIRLKIKNLVGTLEALYALEKESFNWQKKREFRKKIIDFGILFPTIQELSLSTSLYKDLKLIQASQEIYGMIASEIAGLKKDLLDLNQEMESYSDRLINERALKQLQESVTQRKTSNFVSHLIHKKHIHVGEKNSFKEEEKSVMIETEDPLHSFEESKEFIISLAKRLNIVVPPLYLSQEDFESAFFLLAAPYMTEGSQGNLPRNLALLKEDIVKGFTYLKKMHSSPFLGLEKEKEKMRKEIKTLENIIEPFHKIVQFLESCKEKETRKSTLFSLIRKKNEREENLERIEKEEKEVEKDLHILEGIEALLVELTLLKTF